MSVLSIVWTAIEPSCSWRMTDGSSPLAPCGQSPEKSTGCAQASASGERRTPLVELIRAPRVLGYRPRVGLVPARALIADRARPLQDRILVRLARLGLGDGAVAADVQLPL